ncbi:MAG: CAP domain-containing protein [Anaerolineae bacterium]|nr:CAP domain-containing protein [Anaerolineae bacterium]
MRKKLSIAASPLSRTVLLAALAVFTLTSMTTTRAQAPPAAALGTPPVAAAQPAPPVAAPLLAQADEIVFLPLVSGPAPPLTCAPNAEEAALADLMRDHPDQQRPSLTCHPILAQVAREHAEDMRDHGYVDVVNSDGYGPNYLVRAAGYTLPSYYDSGQQDNNIESVAGGFQTAEAAWEGWMGSEEGHRVHLLGQIDFYARQVDYGIGYASGGYHQHYWVVITAEPGP